MPRTTLLATACIAGLLAGCGSSSNTPTTPASAGPTRTSTTGRGALTHTGRVGTVGSSASGKLNATNPTVLKQIESHLVTYYTSKGFSGITAICSGRSATTASCRVTGTNSSSQTSSAVITIALDPTTGVLKVVHVAR